MNPYRQIVRAFGGPQRHSAAKRLEKIVKMQKKVRPIFWTKQRNGYSFLNDDTSKLMKKIYTRFQMKKKTPNQSHQHAVKEAPRIVRTNPSRAQKYSMFAYI